MVRPGVGIATCDSRAATGSEYKAESAGRAVIAVDPRNTSRTCADCDHVSAGNRRRAVFECQACGHQAHADTNAAINVLRAGRALQHIAASGRH